MSENKFFIRGDADLKALPPEQLAYLVEEDEVRGRSALDELVRRVNDAS